MPPTQTPTSARVAAIAFDPLRTQLARCERPARVFFRDDDAGPDDERLYRLLDLFALYRVPLDLAVIPAALEPRVAAMLAGHRAAEPALLGLHQHGYRHVNHETAGRKSEFGPSRGAAEQRADLVSGRERLREALGPLCDPFFTPPWNRCTQATASGLAAIGCTVLSRSRGAPAIGGGTLATLDVDVDWVKLTASADHGAVAAAAIAATLAATGRCGIMLHHAVMTEDQFALLERLLELLGRGARVRTLLMRDIPAAETRAPHFQETTHV